MIETILLQKNSKFTVNEKVNLILSCEFYWLRVFDIPIDSHKEVISVLPSFFEDFFDTSDYSYYAIKLEKHKYLCFAYKQSDILDAIKNANLQVKQISSIYFAQNEFVNIFKNEKFYKFNESVYALDNDIVVTVPPSISSNLITQAFEVNKLNLSKHKIFINQTSKYIDAKTSYILSLLFMLFALIIFAKTIDINNSISLYDAKTTSLKDKYNLLPSKIQTRSVINEYDILKNDYLKFTNALSYILEYKSRVNTKLIAIEFKNKKISIKFDNKNKERLNKYISKKYKILSSKISNNILTLEVKI